MNVEIINILDRSGSMGNIDREACGSFNRFVDEQRSLPGAARMTTVRFDDQYQIDYSGLPIERVPHMRSLEPRGWTALLDAIGKTLLEQGDRIRSEGWAHKVIVCIVTDGQENRSREFSQTRIRKMISEYQERGWAFVFLGANIDAFAVAESYGIHKQHVSQFVASGAGVAMGYATASASVRTLRGTTF